MLVIALRNNNDHANNDSGNLVPDQVAIVKPMLKKPTNKYEWSVTTVPQNKEPRIGPPTSQTSKMT